MQPPVAVGTVIFVDIDGVLNVGIKDPPESPLNFSYENITKAYNSDGLRSRRIAATYERLQEGETAGGATYAELINDDASGISQVLAGRLVELLRAAGGERLVVLSSTWRMPKYKSRVERVEKHVSALLGETFQFDDRTAICKDCKPCLRLSRIGEYIEGHCHAWHRRARVIVLEDFHITPLNGWSVEGQAVERASDAERFLARRAPPSHSLSTMLVHTVDQWTTAEGTCVEIGCGISRPQVSAALSFIAEGQAERQAETDSYRGPLEQQRYRNLLWLSGSLLSLKTFAAFTESPQVPAGWDCNPPCATP